jgi:hypothetical protein
VTDYGIHREDPCLSLDHDRLKALHAALLSGWSQWVEDAPESYKLDGFLESHRPISMVTKHGQNQLIASPTTLDVDMASWDTERDYKKIRHVNFGLATHIRCAFPEVHTVAFIN